MTKEPWYRRWFGEEYLRLYPHRDADEADRAVELLVDRVPLAEGDRVLDLACGAGRHLRALASQNLRMVGFDLSLPLLRRAVEEGTRAPLVRGDMRRLPFSDDAFSTVTSFFTSFGYFESDRDDRVVLGEIRRVLRPNGFLLLDFLNADRVRETLSPRTEKTVGKRRVVQERQLIERGTVVQKTIRIEQIDRDEADVFHERVRLYSADELDRLLASANFSAQDRFGSYDGAALGPASPRVIILARKG